MSSVKGINIYNNLVKHTIEDLRKRAKLKEKSFIDILKQKINYDLLSDEQKNLIEKNDPATALEAFLRLPDRDTKIKGDHMIITNNQTGEVKEISMSEERQQSYNDFINSNKDNKIARAQGFIWEEYGEQMTKEVIYKIFPNASLVRDTSVYNLGGDKIDKERTFHYDYQIDLPQDDGWHLHDNSSLYIEHKADLNNFHITSSSGRVQLDSRIFKRIVGKIYDSFITHNSENPFNDPEFPITMRDIIGVQLLKDKIDGYFPVFQSSEDTLASSHLLDDYHMSKMSLEYDDEGSIHDTIYKEAVYIWEVLEEIDQDGKFSDSVSKSRNAFIKIANESIGKNINITGASLWYGKRK